MKLAERDFRLEQIRVEKKQLQRAMDEKEKKWKEQNEKSARKRKEYERRQREIENQGFFKRHWSMLTSSNSLLDGFDGVSDLLTAPLEMKWVEETEKRLKELKEEEARLLGVKVDDEPKVNDREGKKNEIFQRRSNRLLEKEARIRQETGGKARANWTDEETERVKRLENAYEQADARDIQELSKIL